MAQTTGFLGSYATVYGNGTFGIGRITIPDPSGLIGKALALGIKTYQSSYGTSYATAYGGFFAFSGPQALPTKLSTVLATIASTIKTAGIVAQAASWVTLPRGDPFPTAGGPLAIVSPGRFATRTSHQDGLGRNLATRDGTFVVHVADRCGKDLGGQDTIRLLESDTGLLDLAHAVEDLLNGQFVEDAGPNLLSIEPMFYQGQSQPALYEDQTWAGIDLTFSLSFVAVMTVAGNSSTGGS